MAYPRTPSTPVSSNPEDYNLKILKIQLFRDSERRNSTMSATPIDWFHEKQPTVMLSKNSKPAPQDGETERKKVTLFTFDILVLAVVQTLKE